MYKNFAIYSVLFFQLLCGLTYAQEVITMDRAISIALEKNISIAQAYNDVRSADLAVLSSYGAYIPEITASARWERGQTNSPANFRTPWNGDYGANLGLTYTLFDGFRRELNHFNTLSKQTQSEVGYERTKQRIVYTVKSLYINVIRTSQLVKVSEENLATEKKRLERMTEQNKVGSIAIGDVYRQQSSVASAELRLINSQSSHKKAIADLLNILALDVNTDYKIYDETLQQQVDAIENDPNIAVYGSFEELKERAITSRLDYKSAQEALSIAKRNVFASWSYYLPTINLSANVGANTMQNYNLYDSRRYSYGIVLSWTLPEIFSSISRIQNAQIYKNNAELQLEQKVRDISVEVKNALLDLEASRKQYEVSQKNVIAASQDRKVVEEKYNLGSGTLLDYQIANASYLDAQVTKVNNAFGYILSKHNLDLVIGEKKY